jgi:hypothetical protein
MDKIKFQEFIGEYDKLYERAMNVAHELRRMNYGDGELSDYCIYCVKLTAEYVEVQRQGYYYHEVITFEKYPIDFLFIPDNQFKAAVYEHKKRMQRL